MKDAAAATGRLVGSEVEAELLRSDREYVATVKREFSIITPQNEMKLGWVGKQRGGFDFSDADTIVEFALQNGMKVRGHTLAWHRNFPKWLEQGALAPKELEDVLLSFVREAISHYRVKFPGQVISWDVVNEAIARDGKLRAETLWNRVGKKPGDYIALAFREARRADPGVALFYNDFGAEQLNAKSDGIYALLRSLKKRGVPIDGIGFQMHLDYRDSIDVESVRKNMERFARLGLKIHVTEIDFQLPENPTDAQLEQQARAYRDMASICVSVRACEAFVSWGFTDAHSWIPHFFPGYGKALYFDEQYRRKAAYDGLISGLAQRTQ